MRQRPPRSTLDGSAAASDVNKGQGVAGRLNLAFDLRINLATGTGAGSAGDPAHPGAGFQFAIELSLIHISEPTRPY